jgi:hypothetical protein
LLSDLICAEKIVGIEVLKEVTLRFPQRRVPGCRGASVLLSNDLDPCALVSLSDRLSLIRGAVIHHDNLDIGP